MLPRVVLTPLKVNGAHVESAAGMCTLMVVVFFPQVLGTWPPSVSISDQQYVELLSQSHETDLSFVESSTM